MSRSRESRPRGSRKQHTKIDFAALARTLNRLKKNYHGAQGFVLLAHFLLLKQPQGRLKKVSNLFQFSLFPYKVVRVRVLLGALLFG